METKQPTAADFFANRAETTIRFVVYPAGKSPMYRLYAAIFNEDGELVTLKYANARAGARPSPTRKYRELDVANLDVQGQFAAEAVKAARGTDAVVHGNY